MNDHGNGHQADLDVEQQRPVGDVEEIVLEGSAARICSVVSVSPRHPLTCAHPVMPGFIRCRPRSRR